LYDVNRLDKKGGSIPALEHPVRLAFYTYSYTDRLELPVPETLARIAKAGYCGIDESSTFGPHLNSDSVSLERRTLIRETALKHKLKVEAIVTHGELTRSLFADQKLDLISAVDLAAEMGGDVVTFHLGGSVEGVTDTEVWNRTVAAIKVVANHGDTKHVRVAIDCGPWPTWIVKNNDDLARLFSDVDSRTFGVNFDPCYLAVAGIDPVGFVERFGSRIWHVHLKDYRGIYPKFEHKIPGQGILDYAPIIKALHNARFQDALAMECFTDMPLDDACDIGYAAMKRAFDKTGVTFCPS
jgi:sugar phosphate isomerase/epimerase